MLFQLGVSGGVCVGSSRLIIGSLGAGLTGPLVVSTTSLVWMLTQREAYTGLASLW